DPGALHRAARRAGAHLGRPQLARAHAALRDPGTRADPLVGGVEDLREIVVRHDVLGQVPAGAGDLHPRRRLVHASGSPVTLTEMCRALWRTMPDRTALAATASALRIALGGEPP